MNKCNQYDMTNWAINIQHQELPEPFYFSSRNTRAILLQLKKYLSQFTSAQEIPEPFYFSSRNTWVILLQLKKYLSQFTSAWEIPEPFYFSSRNTRAILLQLKMLLFCSLVWDTNIFCVFFLSFLQYFVMSIISRYVRTCSNSDHTIALAQEFLYSLNCQPYKLGLF